MEAASSTNDQTFVQQSSNLITNWVKDNNMVIIIILIAIFLGIAFLIFTYFVQPSLNSTYVANNEFTQFDPDKKNWSQHIGKGVAIGDSGTTPTTDDGDSPPPPKSIGLVSELYLFYAEWCPYSKKLRQENGAWDKLKQEFPNNEKVGTYILKYNEINGDTDTNAIQEFEKQYLSGAEGLKKKIDGYPSIYLKKDDQIIEFEAEPSFAGLKEFINTIIVNNYSDNT